MCEPTAVDHLQANAVLSDVGHSVPTHEPRERWPERPLAGTTILVGIVRVGPAGSRRRHCFESGSQRRPNCEPANTLGAEPTSVSSASPHRWDDTDCVPGTEDLI